MENKENIEEKNVDKKSDKKLEDKKRNKEQEKKMEKYEKEIAECKKLLEDTEKKTTDFEQKFAAASDKYLRLMAEFDNFRRRSAKERLDLISTAEEDIIVGMLPILDDCEHALKALKESKADDSAKEGTELILSKLFNYLKSRGVDKIDAIGKELDTDFHEAVAQFPVEEPEKKNKIIDIVQQGYTLRGKVIRYAKVVMGV
jgi:molecular chaperone GrpE